MHQRWFSFDPRTAELAYFLSDKHSVPYRVLAIQSCEVEMDTDGSSTSFGFFVRPRNSVSASWLNLQPTPTCNALYSLVLVVYPSHDVHTKRLTCIDLATVIFPFCSRLCHCLPQVKQSEIRGCGLFKMLLL